MGANSELFLHLRDAEINGGGYSTPPPSLPDQDDYYTYYITSNGKIVRQVGRNGWRIHCEYPGSEKCYTFNKRDLDQIYDLDKKKEAQKLFKR